MLVDTFSSLGTFLLIELSASRAVTDVGITASVRETRNWK